MTKYRVVAAGLPAAGMTVFAAALALTGQPAHAAPQGVPNVPGLQALAHPATLVAPDAVTAGNSGLLTGDQVNPAAHLPVSLACNAIAVAGSAVVECPDGAAAGSYGTGGGRRGNPGYATPTVTAFAPTPPGGAGTSATPGGGRGNGGYGYGETPTPSPSVSPTPSPTSSRSTGPACCGVSPGGPGGGGSLPVTGLPMVALAAAGGLLIGGGVALRYAGRHRRNVAASR